MFELNNNKKVEIYIFKTVKHILHNTKKLDLFFKLPNVKVLNANKEINKIEVTRIRVKTLKQFYV